LKLRLGGIGPENCSAPFFLRGPNDDRGQVMGAFFDRIAHPALTDIRVDWGTMQSSDVFPREVPDLFGGRPVILMGEIQDRWAAVFVSLAALRGA
jgi:hypothetical protein